MSEEKCTRHTEHDRKASPETKKHANRQDTGPALKNVSKHLPDVPPVNESKHLLSTLVSNTSTILSSSPTQVQPTQGFQPTSHGHLTPPFCKSRLCKDVSTTSSGTSQPSGLSSGLTTSHNKQTCFQNCSLMDCLPQQHAVQDSPATMVYSTFSSEVSKDIGSSQIQAGADMEEVHCQVEDGIKEKYQLLELLLQGAEGNVYKARDIENGVTVAIKQLDDVFRSPFTCLHALREIRSLVHLRGHPNIVFLQDVIKTDQARDLYLVFEFVATDLYLLIADGVDKLREYTKRYVMYQLLNAIRAVHSAGIIHRDVKTSNILVSDKYVVKLCDFGHSRPTPIDSADAKLNDQRLTNYVVSRWYRAPEILLRAESYSTPIDMWSVGCIVAELYTGEVLFRGTTSQAQLKLILSALPAPNTEDISSFMSGGISQSREPAVSLHKGNLEELLGNAPLDAIALVKALLVLNAHKRLTAVAALDHDYVQCVREGDKDTSCFQVPPLSPTPDTQDVKHELNQIVSALSMSREMRS